MCFTFERVGTTNWFRMADRRLEDRIRELCAKAASAPAREVEVVLKELRVALAEHAKRLRLLGQKFLCGRRVLLGIQFVLLR